MRRGLDWYKRDPIAFLDGVQGMGPDLIGAYAVILDLLYARAGETPRDDRHLAGILGCSTRMATSLTDRLIELGKLQVRDGFIHNSRVEIVAKSRRELSEARSNAGRIGGEKSADVRKNKSLGEATARSKTQAEKEVEKEVEKNPLTPLSGGSPQAAQPSLLGEMIVPQPPEKPPKRKRSLPPDWAPNDKNLADARDRGFTEQEISRESNRFRDHHLARGTVMLDWNAAWRTWLGNVDRFAPRATGGPAGANGAPTSRNVGGIAGAALRSRARREGLDLPFPT